MSTTRPFFFHVDLSDAPPDHDYVFIARDEEQTLSAHTEESRQQLSANLGANTHNAISARFAKATHFTSAAAMMPTESACRVHLKAIPKDPSQPSWVYAATMCIPQNDLAENESANEVVDWVSTAQTFLFHHPDLQTPNANVAKIVWEHLSPDTHPSNYQLIEELALEMAIAGIPTTDPNQGWATLVPLEHTMDDGETMYFQQPTPDIQKHAGDAMTAVMNSSKNDLRLKDKMWMYTPGVSTESSSANVPQFAAAIHTGLEGDSWVATVDHVNPVHGMTASVTVLDPATRRVRLQFENSFLRYLAAYIQFLDADMKPMSTPTWSPEGGSFFDDVTQYDNFRGLGSMAPIQTILAIPVPSLPGKLDVEIIFPAGAVAAGIFGCGLAARGERLYPKANVYGATMTGVVNFAIPTLMLGFGALSETWAPLHELMSNPVIIGVVVTLGAAYFGAKFIGAGMDKKMDWSAAAKLGDLIFTPLMKPILAWVLTKITTATMRNAVPFAGWVMLALNVASGLMQLTMSIVHTTSSPWNIPNRLATTIDTQVTILPDPRSRVFPQAPAGSSAMCVVEMIFQSNRPTVTNMITDITDTSLNARFINQLGGRVKFEAKFYAGTRLAATASTGFLPNDQANATNITLVMMQSPVELDDQSVYLHSQIVRYQNNAYQWTPSPIAPTTTITSRNASQTGNAISVWQGLALSQRHAHLAWAWKAAGLGIPSTSGTRGTQLFAMQTMDIPGMPNPRPLFPTAGLSAQNNIVCDPYPPKFQMKDGQWVIADGRPVPDPNDTDLGSYWVDPRKAALDTEAGGGYHLRKIDGSFDTSPTQPSYGRFPWAPDSLVMHPSGHVVAVHARAAKLMVLQLSETGKADDALPVAQTFAGQGMDLDGSGPRAGLLLQPVAITCTYDGTILVLERTRIQAFDLNGNPVNAFEDAAGNPMPFLPIDPSPTPLDITCSGTQDLAYIHVLSYRNQGTSSTDYEMAIYQFGTKATKKNPLATTTGMSAARIVTDMWHSIYALNWEMTRDGRGEWAGPRDGSDVGERGRTVPSISLWMPPQGA